MKILLVTNDFPPRVGGIQVYLHNIYRRLAEQHEVTVFAPAHAGDVGWDARQPFSVVRNPGSIYWPTPSIVARVRRLAADADVVAFGAVLPMSFAGHRIDRPIVLHTHGFEVAAARLPGARSLLRSLAERASLVTVVSEFCGREIRGAIETVKSANVQMLKTGVDLEMFRPDVDGLEIRKFYGLQSQPVVCCVSRLVERKGQDQLIKAMPHIIADVPDAVALIVGGGPDRESLERLARERRVMDHVVFTGEVPWSELPPHYAAGDVFAMPCRTRKAGLEVEGLGLVYLEAQASGKPAIAGDSGGAPESVIEGETGFVVPRFDERFLARRVSELFLDPARRASMGAKGRSFVEQQHSWPGVVDRFDAMIAAIV